MSLHRQIPFVSLGEPNHFYPDLLSPVVYVSALGAPARTRCTFLYIANNLRRGASRRVRTRRVAVSATARVPAAFCAIFLPSRPEKRAAVNVDAQIARQDARFPKLAGISFEHCSLTGANRRTGALAWSPEGLTQRSFAFETATPG